MKLIRLPATLAKSEVDEWIAARLADRETAAAA
jgi:hypothetical protein